MDMLSTKQLKVLGDVLYAFERITEHDTAVRMISGGFADASMFNYDDDFIDIELKWGVQSDCQNTVHTENYKLAVSDLDNDSLKPAEKCGRIQSA